jgi:hypothetical protein
MKKNIILAAISFFLMTGLLLAGLFLSSNEILIQSLESRTLEDQPVYNKIKWIKNATRDIWMMNQSHHGLNPSVEKWERLAIVVENQKVSFYQFKAGPLVWSDDLIQQQVQYRASCFQCHTNGPRAIRPDQKGLKLSWSDQTKIFFWNLKMKSYGRLTENSQQAEIDKNLEVPFRHRTDLDNETLEVVTCLKCHKEKGFISRGKLTRQNTGAIEFMVKSGLMPPFGFSLSDNERHQIDDFIKGF